MATVVGSVDGSLLLVDDAKAAFKVFFFGNRNGRLLVDYGRFGQSFGGLSPLELEEAVACASYLRSS